MELFCKSAIYKLFTGAPKSARMSLRARYDYAQRTAWATHVCVDALCVRSLEISIDNRNVVLHELYADVATAWATQVCVDALCVAKNR